MQKISRAKAGLLLMLAALFGLTMLPASFATPAYAQDEEPTAVPRNDPLWVQFTAARRAIEEERSVDLTYVNSYQYVQQEYVNGIDAGCDTDVIDVDVRPVYFGFTWTITDLGGTVHQARTAILPGNELIVAVCDEVTQVAIGSGDDSSGDTGGEPVAGSGATGDFELGGHVLNMTPAAIDAMNQSGMTWMKKQVRYNLGDGTGAAADAIAAGKDRGFKVLLGIVGYPEQMGDYNSYVATFAQYLGEVAALNPDAIEIWNEPNIAREWPSGDLLNGARYTEMLRAGYEAIKAVNPNVIVISGAPAPTGAEAAFPGQVVNDDNFMQQMRSAGATNYMDCIGLHYNEGTTSPEASSGAAQGDNFPTRYFGTMLARGANIFPERPVCWTELGYLSGEGMGAAIPGNFSWASSTTLDQHATWVAQAASLSAQSGRVRMMIVWNVNFTRWDSDPMGGYAIIRPDGSCPACSLLGSVMGG